MLRAVLVWEQGKTGGLGKALICIRGCDQHADGSVRNDYSRELSQSGHMQSRKECRGAVGQIAKGFHG